MSSHTDLTHSMTEVAEIERPDEDMTASEGTRSDPLRPLTDDSANATRDSNILPVPPIVISSDEAPEISVQTPRSGSRDMPRRATSVQPVRRSPRLRARTAASVMAAQTEPASPPPDPETSKNPATSARPATTETPTTRPTEPNPTERAVPEHSAPGDNNRSNHSDMSEEGPRHQQVYCEGLDTWFPAPSLYDDLDPTSEKS